MIWQINFSLSRYERAMELKSLETLSEDREWRCSGDVRWKLVP